MCGVAGVISLSRERLPWLGRALDLMNRLLAHRGPDGSGTWIHADGFVGFAHRRLSIIDIEGGAQPMGDGERAWVTFNGEIYNHVELRAALGAGVLQTRSDTEVLLRLVARDGEAALSKLRGMFAFGLYDGKRLLLARDPVGIKPLYWCQTRDALFFASEQKALLPFLNDVDTDARALREYMAFQFCLGDRTLFAGVRALEPGHTLVVEDGQVSVKRYAEVRYQADFSHTEEYFIERTRALIDESLKLHLRSDVPVGAYVSGGIDSSSMALLAARAQGPENMLGFTAHFDAGPQYDETRYARAVAAHGGFELHDVAITETDFVEQIERVIYHLDQPVAGPGSFPQFMVSRLAAKHRKVVLGGQGGDEVFGGYVRYLIAYFEQCIRAAIDGTMNAGNFVVTYESIIPNLGALGAYKPLLQEFWRDGLFEEMDRRYFRLVNRANDLADEVHLAAHDRAEAFSTFQEIFASTNVASNSYFDRMTNFDMKTLLPALLHVEDRMSMAHGLESRVPLVDSELVRFAATMPANVKFKNGTLKSVLKNAMGDVLPSAVLARKDKMGFPVPLVDWMQREGPVREFVLDLFHSRSTRERGIVNHKSALAALEHEGRYGRKVWGLLGLELWQRTFHDGSSAKRFSFDV